MPKKQGKRFSFAAGFNAWPINRPHFAYSWCDDDRVQLSLLWGNGNSDPVWYVDIELFVPKWLERRLP